MFIRLYTYTRITGKEYTSYRIRFRTWNQKSELLYRTLSKTQTRICRILLKVSKNDDVSWGTPILYHRSQRRLHTRKSNKGHKTLMFITMTPIRTCIQKSIVTSTWKSHLRIFILTTQFSTCVYIKTIHNGSRGGLLNMSNVRVVGIYFWWTYTKFCVCLLTNSQNKSQKERKTLRRR